MFSEKLVELDHSYHYLCRYIKFINWCFVTNNYKEISIFEKHHICPKSLFPEYSNLSKNKWNLIRLTPRQHFIAHYLLAKAYGGKMIQAFFCMSKLINSYHNRNTNNSKEYEKMKIDLYIYLSERNSGEGNAMYGKKHSEESKKLITEKALSREKNGMLGKTHSDETKKLMGIVGKEKFKDENFYKKFCNKMKEIHNKPEWKIAHSEKIKEWHRKNHHPRLGHKNSEDHRAKISESLKTYWTNNSKDSISGENNPMYGKTPSDESKAKTDAGRKRYLESMSIEEKERISKSRTESNKKEWADPKKREKRLKTMRSPEYREAMSKAVREGKRRKKEERLKKEMEGQPTLTDFMS